MHTRTQSSDQNTTMMFQRGSSVGIVVVLYYTLFWSVKTHHVHAFCPSAPTVASLLSSSLSSSLTTTGSKNGVIHRIVASPQTSTLLFAASLPSPEESAKALQEYMAKSHEQKLKAIQDAEAKKQIEIDALKAQVEELKAGGGAITTTTAAAPTDDVKELQQKLLAYQNFMAKYIVDAQEAKARAIAEAQAMTAATYEQKLLAAGVVGSPSSSAETTASLPSSSSSSSTTNNQLYQNRNTMVSKAAAAGKSRWGEAEVQRLSSGKATAPVPATADTAPTPADYVVMPVSAIASTSEVVNADHGLRNDGGVGGPSLAERVASGAAIADAMSGTTTTTTTSNKLYQDRNTMVSKAALAGKSRWGESELQRLSSGKATAPVPANAAPATAPAEYAVMPVSMVASTPEIVNADHGLRNDGGVGGPTLAERVANGAAIAETMSGTTTTSSSSSSSSNDLYSARNKAVADAGRASRWGSMEVERAATAAAGATIPINGAAASVNGATIASTTTTNQILYYARNQVIAKAGVKSRWGPMEVKRATTLAAMPPPPPSTATTTSPEIAAANHGLRADGGVSGPTLAERVNLGAKILAGMK